MIVNGVLSRLEPSAQQRESLTVIGVSGLEGTGQILERPRGGAPTLVVRARLTLVLNTHSPLSELEPGTWNPGNWISFTTEPLLHGFTLSTSKY